MEPCEGHGSRRHALDALRGLLHGEPFDFESEFFSFEKAWILPPPDPPLRITIGGRSEAAPPLAYAGRSVMSWTGPRSLLRPLSARKSLRPSMS